LGDSFTEYTKSAVPEALELIAIQFYSDQSKRHRAGFAAVRWSGKRRARVTAAATIFMSRDRLGKSRAIGYDRGQIDCATVERRYVPFPP